MTETHKLASKLLSESKQVSNDLSVAQLVAEAIKNGEGVLSSTGAIMCDTGKYTGRSPQDRFIVEDDYTKDRVWWGSINKPFPQDKFNGLASKMVDYLLDNQKLYVNNVYAGADPSYRIKVRVVTPLASVSHFVNNMFIVPSDEELRSFGEPDYVVLQAPDFNANPDLDGTRQGNFSILNFGEKAALVGGSRYTGEIKKGIFSVLNALLIDQDVLPMHCSANESLDGESAVFFGLSGTGKTTLSADPDRNLIGDDEHGWSANGIYNFEGGCYAKTIDLTRKNEPEIWDAIKFGATLENTRFFPGTSVVDYTNVVVTENTRVSYPIEHISNAKIPSVSETHPKNIFFLTCDAYGVLPAISKLTKEQAMYHFMSGYTAKVAGTEAGITEPTPTFSACFGAPFMPLHPSVYAKKLGEKMTEHNTNIWLINTGWSNGPSDKVGRTKLKYTRAMITAALEGKLDQVEFVEHPVFGVQIPTEVPNVPKEALDARQSWIDNGFKGYDETAMKLAGKFVANFKKFEDGLEDKSILQGAPSVAQKV
ncbi:MULTISPECIES: phosphoenolpyruvate carboxykinase (ATP) [Flammeovirga]|uniref:Phosphoenolpyruvate carboxykinase (ATP) n=1 Tax=Flammeovirga agarivorans TaxID=2726742 RepID=A0A7X8SH99_9BACT|nr:MULTISPECIES: phosphoenolpyruvate carboxykinase (ATP) [Flammeovirga]NLR90221.1 phosphoenolpyruvate carboxykinase (ATP) [Flammeovirga agarivorans]